MANFAEFPQQNLTLKPAPGDEATVGSLPVFHDGKQFVSCWQLTAEELVEVLRTGRVWLYVMGRHPPVYVGGLDPFEASRAVTPAPAPPADAA